MNQNDPSAMVRMLDDFRSGTSLHYRRQSGTYLANPLGLAVPLTPIDRAKRPFDETLLNDNDMLIKRSKKSDSDLNVDDDSLSKSFDSPWEITHVKSQLTQARAEVKVLESQLSKVQGLKKETELLYEQQKAALKTTIDQNRNTIQQLEKRVSVLKRREEKLKEDISALIEKMNSDRSDKESRNIALYDENTDLKHKIRQLEENIMTKQQEIKSLHVQNSKLESDLNLENEKFSTVNEELVKLRLMVSELEKTKAALAMAQLRVQELESERKSYEEMDLMVKSQQAKLMRYSELEKNLKHYVYQNSKLKVTCSNTVQLESMVEEMRQRLSTLEEREKEIMKLRVDLGVAETKLEEYRALALLTLGEGAGPTQLGAYVKQLQANSLLAVSQQSQLSSKIKSMEESEKVAFTEIGKLKLELEMLRAELSTTNANLKRLKKQNALIIWERNDLRSLIDSCQKEVTIGGHQSGGEGNKVELLEKLIDGYRERIQQMEADPSLITPASGTGGGVSSSVMEKESAEIEKLKSENQQLKQKVDQMEFEMEHRALKGDFNTLNTKILHFKNNPTTLAMNAREDELERLRKELFDKEERLKMYIEGNNMNDITQIIAQKQDIAKEVNELREKVKSQETVNQRLREAFKTKSNEFREAIFALLGYKVDGLPNSLYRLSNFYAVEQEPYLMFKMTGSGMELLETEYSKTLTELIEEVLVRHHSIPVFLSTLTIDLFKKQSQSLMTTSSSIR